MIIVITIIISSNIIWSQVRGPTRHNLFIHIHPSVFAASDSKQVYCILNNRRMWTNTTTTTTTTATTTNTTTTNNNDNNNDNNHNNSNDKKARPRSSARE